MHTIIATFKDHAAAERACDKLVQTGVARDNIHIEEGQRGHEARGRGMVRSFGSALGSILGLDDPESHAKVYDEASADGKSVMLVDVDGAQQAEAVSAILREMGADESAMRTVERDSMERVKDMLEPSSH